MSEQDTAIEDNVAVDAPNDEEQNAQAPDYSDIEQDKLIEMLKERDEEVSKSKKSYDEYRSMTDRKANETAERLAKLEGKYEATQAQAEVKPQKDPADFLKEMEDAIEEDPKNTAKYLAQLANEFQEVINENKQSFDAKFEKRLAEQSPVYKANKDFVDQCVERGMGLHDAIDFAAEVKANEVSQPGTPKAPGVVEASRAASSKEAPPKIEVSAHDIKVMKDCGLSDEDIDGIIKKTSKDMVSE